MATQETPSTPRNSRDVLAERLRSLTYEVDHTAAKPANRVVEVRTLTDANRSAFNHIIPKAAPFYAHTMRIFHTQTNDEYINGQDFYCVGSFAKAVTNVVDNREVCWSVIFDDPRISGEYRLEYQTVGGEFVLDQQEMAEVLANFVENPRTTDWEQVVGRPLSFPPLPHDVHVNDLRGFNEQVEATNDVAKAIRELIRDEEQDHPGYGQVITELFRQQQRQDQFQKTIDALKLQNTQSTASLAERLSTETARIEMSANSKIRELEERINTDIKAKLNRIDTDYKAADISLEGKINKAKSDLTSTIDSKESALRELINSKDAAQTSARNTAISGLTSQLNSMNTSIRADFASADRALERKIEALRNSQSSATSSSLGDAKSYTDRKVGEVNQTLTQQSTEAERARQELRKLIDANKTLSDTAETNLRRDLTSETSARNTAISGLSSRLTAVEGSITTKANEINSRIDEVVRTAGTQRTDFNALKARIDGAAELVKITGNQTITGIKTFTNTIKLANSNNATQNGVIGFGANDLFIHNSASGKFLQLRNNGEIHYDNKRILQQPDLDNLNSTINGVRNSLSNYVPTNGNHTINGEKTFTGQIVVMGGTGGQEKMSIYADSTNGFLFHYGAGVRRSTNPHFRLRDEGFELRAGQSRGYAVGTEGDQSIGGTKSFKHWVRLRRSDNDDLYSEWSFEPNYLFRYWADGRNRMWLDNDGRFHLPRGLAVGNTANRNDDDYRWSVFTVNWNDADPYLLLSGAGGGDAANNYGRLSVHDLYVRSDKRIKHDINKIEKATDKLEAINGYTYFLNGSKTKSGGVIAQELIEVMPEIVHLRKGGEGEEEFYSVQYHGVIALLIEALKESNQRIKALEEKHHV